MGSEASPVDASPVKTTLACVGTTQVDSLHKRLLVKVSAGAASALKAAVEA